MAAIREEPPLHPFEVRISIGGDDWAYVRRALRELADEIEERAPEAFRICSGGGGGSYSVTTVERDVSVEAFHAELEGWRQRLHPRIGSDPVAENCEL